MFDVRGFAVAALLLSALQAEDVPVQETWSLARLQGQNVGYVHHLVISRTTKSGLRYVTEDEELLKIKRDDQDLTVHTTNRVLEASYGTVIDFQKTVEEGGSPLITRGYRDGDQMVVWERGAENRYPMPKEALGPYAADLKNSALPLQVGSSLESLTFDTAFPQKPVKVDRSVVVKESHETMQGDQELWKIKTALDSLPGLDLTDWVDDHGQVVASEIPFGGFGSLELLTCTKEEAMQLMQGREIFNSSVVIPDKPLTDYRSLHTASYHLSGPEKLTVVSDAVQTVLEQPDGSALVTVQVPSYYEAGIFWSLPAKLTPELQPYLVASSYLELDDPGVQDLAKQAVGSETNPLRAARKIEAFVQGYITHKDLSVGFASAADTVKSRTGDCTEHAVLAAALGRVVGLPTRLVMGLGYVPVNPAKAGADQDNGMFGFHMWAEAYLGPDEWVAMDPALGGFDVGHIALVKSDLATSSDSTKVFLPIMQMIGKLKIEVESTQ
jgi:hypothetical protein